MDFKELARDFGTPLYIYDFGRIQANLESYRKAFFGHKHMICYALKANSNLSILSLIAYLGGGAECVSIGEVKRALRAGIQPYKIIFSGVGKSDEEIYEALKLNILFLNVESENELFRIEDIASKNGLLARISLRINPDIDSKTHPYIATGIFDSKFGVDIQTAKRLYLYAHKSRVLHPIGIHFHIGSQLMELSPIVDSANKVAGLARELMATGLDLRFFDVGGGVGIPYRDEEKICLAEYAKSINLALNGLDLTIICEPGRSVVGECGYLLTRVIAHKRNDKKRFVIVDAGMNDLLRPSLYGSFHNPIHIRVSQDKNQYEDQNQVPGVLQKTDVVGPICESGDFLAKDILMGEVTNGDLIVFENAGAYGYSMSSNYNTRPRVCEVGLIDNVAYIIKDREDIESLMKNESDILLNIKEIIKRSSEFSDDKRLAG